MSPWLAERVIAMERLSRSLGNFGMVLLHLDMNFPDAELVEELSVYANLPDFSNNLYIRARRWLDDGISRAAKQAKVINYIALCGIGLLIGCFASAFMSIQQQFGSAIGGF